MDEDEDEDEDEVLGLTMFELCVLSAVLVDFEVPETRRVSPNPEM